MKDCDDFGCLQDGDAPLLSGHCNGLNANEHDLRVGLPIFKEHRNHFLEITVQIVETLGLRVGTRKPGYIPDVKAGLRLFLDYGSKGSHGYHSPSVR